MNKFNLQRFADEPFDGGAYGDPTDVDIQATAGKDIILSVWTADGSTLLAIKGQKGLTINRSADSIDVTSKDTEGGWKSTIAGMKEWSISTNGIAYLNDASHKVLSDAFTNSSPVLVKVTNKKTSSDMFGGLAYVTDYPIDAPFDDSMTYTMTLQGMGALVDLSEEPEPEPETQQ